MGPATTEDKHGSQQTCCGCEKTEYYFRIHYWSISLLVVEAYHYTSILRIRLSSVRVISSAGYLMDQCKHIFLELMVLLVTVYYDKYIKKHQEEM